ncbi:aminotransferase class III-fold pyridoxal phosphate-dependent enzyme [Streptomyces sp. S1]|uniref:aminotransferase class III-fold pyridoxal phosphate-dependent enzyme n=1 Tax=unclassified Streptomyces TaxID=2593676 RepID=UPI0023E35A83|nr:aminotransferase class III-fold pyridoxal phosphate-dependent enzyme [Streptomyces sp. S1]
MVLNRVTTRCRAPSGRTAARRPHRPTRPSRTPHPATHQQETPMLPTVSHGAGVHVYDTEGREYLDGCSGAINTNLGHGLPEITSRMHRQLDAIAFAYRTQFTSEPLERLSALLTELAPGTLGNPVYGNSGSEAIEAALRLTTLFHSEAHRPFKCTVLTEEPSYHGMTAGALGASGHPARRHGLTPLLANQATVAKVRPRQGDMRADVEQWERAIEEVQPQNLAAVIVEPVGGASSGAVPCDPAVLRRLRELADEHGFLLIADEVMTGLGRTGTWFGCDHAGIVPDVLVLGKGVTAGYAPLSAVLVRDEIAAAFDRPLGSVVFGHTMAGAPLAAAAGLATVEYLKEHDVPALAARSGRHLRTLLEGLVDRHPVVRDVRGRGLQLALGLHAGTAHDLVLAAREHGLLLYPAGVNALTESVLVAPPLNSTEAELEELAVRLDHSLTALTPAPAAQADELVAAH